MSINLLVVESLSNINFNKVTNTIKNNPLGVGALLAGLYTIYAKSKNKEDKIEAAINAFPEAIKKSLIFLISAHGAKNILFGNVDMTNAAKVLKDQQVQTVPNNTSNQHPNLNQPQSKNINHINRHPNNNSSHHKPS